MLKNLVLVFITFSTLFSFAHSFHVGLAYADYDEEKEMLFCTLQLEYNDLSHWLENLALDFNLNEIREKQAESEFWHPFKQFIQKHFSAKTNLGNIEWELFNVELELDGRFFVYLYAKEVKPFKLITWQFSLLMGHSMEQQNKLEFKYITQEKTETHFAYFFENELSQIIKTKPN
jgi:hypothetical protein